jgi:hypothetical protein
MLNKNGFLFYVFLLVDIIGFSQNWDELIVSNSSAINEGMAVDYTDNGVLLFAGNFKDEIAIGNSFLSGSQVQNGFWGKVASNGDVSIMASIRSTQYVSVESIATQAGAVVVSGIYTDSLFVGDDTLINTFQKGIFISVFDVAGNYYYSINPDVNAATVKRTLFDSEGNILVTGDFFKHFNWSEYELDSPAGMSCYLFKYDIFSQELMWLKYSTGTGTYGSGISLDADNDVYLIGSYGDGVEFDGQSLPNADGDHNMFLVKYSSVGNHLWMKTIQGIGQIHGVDVAVNKFGDIYITGDFEFFIDSLEGELIQSSGHANTYVAKMNHATDLEWIVRIGGIDQDRPMTLALDSLGAPVVLINSGQDITIGEQEILSNGFREPMVVKLHPMNGNLVWYKKIASKSPAGTALSKHLVIYENKIAVVGKNLTGMEFNGELIDSPNTGDFFLAILTDTLYIQSNSSGYLENQLAEIGVYPNPVIDGFNISGITHTVVSMAVYSSNGQLLEETEVELGSFVQFHYQPGVYFVRFSMGDQSHTTKLVKL